MFEDSELLLINPVQFFKLPQTVFLARLDTLLLPFGTFQAGSELTRLVSSKPKVLSMSVNEDPLP